MKKELKKAMKRGDWSGVEALYNHLDEVVNVTWNYAKRCKTDNDHWSNATLGLAGEGGEVADRVKKLLYHTEDYTDKHKNLLKYELGDVLYYWLKTIDLAGLTIEEVIAGNKEKLESRHPELGKVEERFNTNAIR